MRFLDSTARVFRSVRTHGNKYYLAWVKKIQGQRQTRWEYLGIFDPIQFLRNEHRVNPCMLLVSIFFWKIITGLSSLGEMLDPRLQLISNLISIMQPSNCTSLIITTKKMQKFMISSMSPF